MRPIFPGNISTNKLPRCTTGDWLFGEFSAADAMYAPVVIRFNGYDVPLDGIEKEYVQTVLNDPDIKSWMEAGRQEKEVIDQDEVKV